jgi:hypothetical protein
MLRMYGVFHATTHVNLAGPESNLASLERKPASTSRGAFNSIVKRPASINVKSKLPHNHLPKNIFPRNDI